MFRNTNYKSHIIAYFNQKVVKVMKYIKRYSIAIICALILLFVGKSCQSCSRARQIEYMKTTQVTVTDSLKSVISDRTAALTTAQDSIKVLNTEINALKEMKGMMQGSLEHARQTNRSLVNSIKSTK